MNKAQSLLNTLIACPLPLKREDVMLIISKGTAVSYVSSDNDNFSMSYDATLVITDYAGSADALMFIILQWMAQHQPTHESDAFQFEADIISHTAVDITINIPLTETIKVTISEAGIELNPVDDPSMEPFWIDAHPDWGIVLKQ